MVDLISKNLEQPTEPKNVGKIVDAKVTVTATPQLMEFVAGVPQLEALRKKLSKDGELEVKDLEDVLTVLTPSTKLLTGRELDLVLDQLIQQGETFKPDGPYLHELLAGSSLNLPKNPEIARDPVLAARVDRLRNEQAEVAYKAMTKNVAAGKFHKEDTVAYQMDMMNRHLIAVGQIILSVGAGFAFGFLGIPLIIGGLDLRVRILLGMFAAVVIAIAELYFLGKYIAAEDAIEDSKLESASKTLDATKKKKD